MKLFKLLLAMPLAIVLCIVSLIMITWSILMLPLNLAGVVKDVPGEEIVGEWIDDLISWHETL